MDCVLLCCACGALNDVAYINLSNLVLKMLPTPSDRPNVWLAPMVDGSELAFRMLCRKHHATLAYSPMLRATQIIQLFSPPATTATTATTATPATPATLATPPPPPPLPVLHPHDQPFVVQLCGNNPAHLHAAATHLLHHYTHHLHGIDFNLGCPQEIAAKENIGAFLAENNPRTAFQCVASLSRAVQGTHCRISTKIRLVEGNATSTHTAATLHFAQQLVTAGIELIAVHVRHRQAKHNGPPDLVTGKALVEALDIPVVINGGIGSLEEAAHVLQVTGCHAVMCAQGFLANPRMLVEEKCTDPMDPKSAVQCASLGCEYLDFCEKFRPPTPYYIRKHLRWIFRFLLQGPSPESSKEWRQKWQKEAWRNQMWHYLTRNYCSSLWQFRQVIHLFCVMERMEEGDIPSSCAVLGRPSFKAIRYRKGGNQKLRKEAPYSYQHLS